VKFGPIGAAKILFGIRPKALIPWDNAIRDHYRQKESCASYLEFLKRIKSIILGKIKPACKRKRFTLAELPAQLGRHNSTIPKLIDEYHWVTITKGCTPPTQDTFQRWAQWGEI